MNTQPTTDPDFTIPSSPWLWLMNIGLLAIVAATLLPLIHVTGDTFRYVFTAGALLALAGRIAAPGYKGNIVRVKRLCRIELWSCIAFCVGAFFIWYKKTTTDWLAFTLAGGALQVYASIMIQLTMNRELRQRKESDTKQSGNK